MTEKIKKSVSFSADTRDPPPAERCGGCQKRHINMIMCAMCFDKVCLKCLINETCRKCYLEYQDAYEKLIDIFD